MHRLQVPIAAEEILKLHVGDLVSLSGVISTARDAAHKFMVETLIEGEVPPEDEDLYQELRRIFQDGVVYHVGPIVEKRDGQWRFVSAGPTTSIREEVYQDKVIEHFGIKVVIGKGGMGPRTLAACKRHKAIYLHGIGGAGTYSAGAVKRVIDVYKKEQFGLPEAFWKIELKDFVGVVTMDAHGESLHDRVEAESKAAWNRTR